MDKRRFGGGRWATVILVASVAGLLLGGAAVARGACVSATLDEPFVLPDGSERQAGRLSLCDRGAHSPVATLHEMRVDGMAVGMQISRRGHSESLRGEQAYLIFSRGADGRLLLDGYTERGSADGATIYALRVPLTEVRTFMLSEAQNRTAATGLVLIAARLD